MLETERAVQYKLVVFYSDWVDDVGVKEKVADADSDHAQWEPCHTGVYAVEHHTRTTPSEEAVIDA